MSGAIRKLIDRGPALFDQIIGHLPEGNLRSVLATNAHHIVGAVSERLEQLEKREGESEAARLAFLAVDVLKSGYLIARENVELDAAAAVEMAEAIQRRAKDRIAQVMQ